MAEGAAVDITIDFDLSNSIVVTGPAANPSYKIKPVLHIVETAGSATIEGTIDNLLFPESYVVITVYDSTDQQQEYTKLQVFKDEDATDVQPKLWGRKLWGRKLWGRPCFHVL